jgi:acyl dehydratase
MIYWQDIQPGQVYETGALTISEHDIMAFAEEFDPQPYHLNRAAADASIFGGLCASGWHVCALMMRLLADTMKSHDVAMAGSSGVPSLRWFIPVFADDTLTATITVTECHTSAQAEFGYVQSAIDVKNQAGRSVIALQTTLMVLHRDINNG